VKKYILTIKDPDNLTTYLNNLDSLREGINRFGIDKLRSLRNRPEFDPNSHNEEEV
jgi:hypothetical protein